MSELAREGQGIGIVRISSRPKRVTRFAKVPKTDSNKIVRVVLTVKTSGVLFENSTTCLSDWEGPTSGSIPGT